MKSDVEIYSNTWDGEESIWDTEKLWKRAKRLKVRSIPIGDIIDQLDEPVWGEPTVNEVLDHMRRIHNADLKYPIILSEEGYVMNGYHRLAKAKINRKRKVKVVRFRKNPKADEVHKVKG